MPRLSNQTAGVEEAPVQLVHRRVRELHRGMLEVRVTGEPFGELHVRAVLQVFVGPRREIWNAIEIVGPIFDDCIFDRRRKCGGSKRRVTAQSY